MVNRGLLSGWHYRANEKVYADIQSSFFKGDNVSVPLYILVGSNGEILDANMPRPSSQDKMYKRIKELIGK